MFFLCCCFIFVVVPPGLAAQMGVTFIGSFICLNRCSLFFLISLNIFYLAPPGPAAASHARDLYYLSLLVLFLFFEFIEHLYLFILMLFIF